MVGFVGMGSNEGDRAGHLGGALTAMVRAGLAVTGVSGVWETEPVGEAGPGWFLNMVARVETERPPEEVLELLLGIESAHGRVRGGPPGPRPIDLDLLVLGSCTRETPHLTLPHPRMWERRFVLAPLGELAPELTRPATGRTVREELDALADPHAARRIGTLDWTDLPPVYSPAP